MNRHLLCFAVWITIAGCAMNEPAPEETEQVSALITAPQWLVARIAANGTVATQAGSGASLTAMPHNATGFYVLTASGITPTAGNILVTPIGGSAHCVVGTWLPSNGRTQIQVWCFAPVTAAVVDSAFSLSYVFDNRTATSSDQIRAAYVKYPGTGSSVTSSFTWSSIGGPGATFFVSNPAPGQFHVIIPGMAVPPGLLPASTVQTTAFGDFKYCNVTGARNGGNFATDRTVDVSCFDATGTPANAAFTLRMWTAPSYGAQDGMCVYNSMPGATYIPGAFDESTTGSSAVSFTCATILSHTTCTINAPGLSLASSAALIDATESDGRYCNALALSGSVGIQYQCYTPAGAPANATFSAAYLDGILGL